MKPRGLRNNNPLNIRHNADVFQGEIKGKDISFKTFSTIEYGYSAAFITLATYLSRGWNTIEKIITRWVPPIENNTENYIANVAKWSGVPKNKILTVSDGADYILIVAAMSFVENGVIVCKTEQDQQACLYAEFRADYIPYRNDFKSVAVNAPSFLWREEGGERCNAFDLQRY
jgi:hypothetical protein